MTRSVTVAIPVRDGGAVLEQTLRAVGAQRLPDGVGVQLLVCDSGSRDGSVALARAYGAEVVEIAPESFSHGGTRNLLMHRAGTDHVALLTQDAVPADEHWLGRLLEGFALAPDVGLVFGPYRPRPGATPMVSRELWQWFSGFSPDGRPRVDRLAPQERLLDPRHLLGTRAFFTDANACISRAAWAEVPFREVSYAEDHALALDMLRAGFAKVYLPEAAVIHSHQYSSWGWLRRSFDEARALHELYGHCEPARPSQSLLKVWGLVGADRRWASEHGAPAGVSLLARALRFHLARITGAVLGSRAEQLPPRVTARLSLERRSR